MVKRTQIFISYSHADKDALARLQVHMKPFERLNKIDVWSDSNIRTGADWRKEIDAAIDRSAVAILLISADFLASDFVTENELPPLLVAAEKEGVQIIPVILKPCAFPHVQEISRFQAINDPMQPLSSMNTNDVETLWFRIATEAAGALKRIDADSERELKGAIDKAKTIQYLKALTNIKVNTTQVWPALVAKGKKTRSIREPIRATSYDAIRTDIGLLEAAGFFTAEVEATSPRYAPDMRELRLVGMTDEFIKLLEQFG
ncbi:MAG: toll/interleukin-1 receptor domain-containing protein [Candidatus Thiodiazotropha sp. LLP2]